MTRIDLEDLLWRMADSPDIQTEDSSTTEGEGRAPELPDAVLEAYRSGHLEAADRRRVEARLAASTADRDRLVELADLPPPAGFASVRRRVLETGRAFETEREPAPPPPWKWRPTASWLAAAALVVLTLGLGSLLSTPEMPPLPEISASITGSATVRSERRGAPTSPQSAGTTATLDTPITVGLRVDPARAGLAVALYRHDPESGSLERLSLPASWPDRETALFRASARELVGDRPGVHRLYAVAAWEGHLPTARRLARDEDPLEALGGASIDVSPLILEIVDGLPSDSSGAFVSPSVNANKEARSP